MIEAAAFHDLASVSHGFFTRSGGVSGGVYASLNCGFGSGDDPGHVAANRRTAMECLGLPHDRLVTAYQVHSPNAVVVETVWEPKHAPRADGMATKVPGIALGILTADCAPVLFADPSAGVVGAAHAGWRGALDGVLESVVAAMTGLGADRSRIVAAVGPCIAQRSYEVGGEFRERFLDEAASNDAYFVSSDKPGRHRFDLPGYVVDKLEKLGLMEIEGLGLDTCSDEARFFSYRRTTLRNEADYGRGLSVVAVAP